MNDHLDLDIFRETLADHGLEHGNSELVIYDIRTEETFVIWKVEYNDEEDRVYLIFDAKDPV